MITTLWTCLRYPPSKLPTVHYSSGGAFSDLFLSQLLLKLISYNKHIFQQGKSEKSLRVLPPSFDSNNLEENLRLLQFTGKISYVLMKDECNFICYEIIERYFLKTIALMFFFFINQHLKFFWRNICPFRLFCDIFSIVLKMKRWSVVLILNGKLVFNLELEPTKLLCCKFACHIISAIFSNSLLWMVRF